MGLIESALARLRQPEAVRAQVLTHLFLARIHQVVKSSYNQFQMHNRDELVCDKQRRPVLENNLEWHATTYTTWHSDDHLHLGAYKLDRKRRNKPPPPYAAEVIDLESSHNQHPHHLWDWQDFPTLWRPLAMYDFASTSWMIWASFRTLFFDQLAALMSPVSQGLLGLPGHCLLLGRLAVTLNVSHLISLVFSSFHLFWRLAQARAKHNRLITVVVFLLTSERDVDHAYKLLLDHQQHQNLHDQAEPPPSQELQLMRHVMCYRVFGNQRVHFKLRPNRTREARRKLMGRTALVTLTTLAFFGTLFLISFTLIMLAVLSDYRYAHVYSGCYPLLDEQLARGQLDLLSITLWKHHLLSLSFDVLENLFLWLDSGLALTFVTAFTYLLNYDLLLYWSALDRKLHFLAERSKWLYLMQQVVDDFGASDRATSTSEHQLPVLRLRQANFFSPQTSLWTLEADIHDLQFEMFDFFQQVRKADLFVGDVLTAAILIWLSGCGFISYNQLTFNNTSLSSTLVKLILVLASFIITLATYHLLELRRRCLRSHQVMCSLIAYDQSCKKRHFTKLMDFYLHNSTSYHLCRTYAYKPTTFITIIGWTFSCFFIAFTLFKPHNSTQAVSQLDPAHNED